MIKLSNNENWVSGMGREKNIVVKLNDNTEVVYNSLAEACKTYSIDIRDAYNRLYKCNWTPEETFGLIPRKRTYRFKSKSIACTVNGIEFPTIAAACRYLNVDSRLVDVRMKRLGWNLEEALGLITHINNRKIPVTVNNIDFPSIRKACEHYNVSYQMTRLYYRKYNISIEEAINRAKKNN